MSAMADRSEIAHLVAYQGDGFTAAMTRYDLEVEDIEELMLEEGFELCLGCHWYFEAGELIEDDSLHGFVCADCTNETMGRSAS